MLSNPIVNWLYISGAKLKSIQLSEIGKIHTILGKYSTTSKFHFNVFNIYLLSLKG